MSTTSRTPDARGAANSGNVSLLSAVSKQIKLGDHLSKIKAVVTALTAIAAVDITAASVKAAAVITGITLLPGENLPPIGVGTYARVTASGTAASVGTYLIADSAATPLLPPGGAGVAVGIASLSADGKTLTFPNTITAFIIEYFPLPSGGMDQSFPLSAP